MIGRGAWAALVCVLLAPPAGAETYQVLSGVLRDAQTGEVEPLTGAFEASVFDSGQVLETIREVLLVDDFQLEAGGRIFGPRGPLEVDGLTPIAFLEPANQINLVGDDGVGFVFLRSGGEVVAVSADEVTFRFYEFRSTGISGGHYAGALGDTGLPRRLDLHGGLFEVDQRFRILRGDCVVPTTEPFPGGGGDGGAGLEISIVDSADRVLTFESFDVDPDEVVEFASPAGGDVQISRVTGGDPVAIGGELVGDGSVVIANPPAVVFGPVTSAVAPTLEELGITATSAAVVTYDDSGALTVTTDGDLIVDAAAIDLPGLTSVTLVAGGSIIITGSLTVPPDVDLFLESGDLSAPPGEIIAGPPIVTPLCFGLRPLFEAADRVPGSEPGRRLGDFSLVATAAQPVAIDVLPGSASDRVVPGFRQLLPVAILGSPAFDVQDVDPGSLRFGPGEAPPRHLLRFRGVLNRDVNGDGIPDVVVWFSTRQSEIAYGDMTACLYGETTDGTLFEGCDEIDTRPTWMSRPLGDFLLRR